MTNPDSTFVQSAERSVGTIAPLGADIVRSFPYTQVDALTAVLAAGALGPMPVSGQIAALAPVTMNTPVSTQTGGLNALGVHEVADEYARDQVRSLNAAMTTGQATVQGRSSEIGGGTYSQSAGIYGMSGGAAAVVTGLANLVLTPAAHQVAPEGAETAATTAKIRNSGGASASNTAAIPAPVSCIVVNLVVTDEASVAPFPEVTITGPHFGQTVMALEAATMHPGGAYIVETGSEVPTPQAPSVAATQFGIGSKSGVGAPGSNVATSAAGAGGAASAATSSPSSGIPTSGSTPKPSWISSLTDSVIKADMTAAFAGGTVSETAMAKLFSDLAAELTANKTTLSASQLTDLKIIATNLNVGENASSYLTYITDALIDGNAANAKWTGGVASSTTLGNLVVGCTATQVAELDGKWFLGTDRPSSSVAMSGASTFNVSYSAVVNPLFGASGPSMNDVNQGYLGDCYLLSSLAEVAKQDPALIGSMITNNGNNIYGVRFFVNGSAEYVTVDNDLPNGGAIFNSATNIWASLVEKAYAQVQASGVITGNSVNYGNSFSTIGNGGAPEYALEEITGASAITDFYANGSSWVKYVYNDAFSVQAATSGLTTASVLATLATDLGYGYDAVLSSRTDATDSSGRTTLVTGHAMSIYGYDSATGLLEIRNPWGSESWQYWDTTFEVSLNTLLGDGDTISVDNMVSASPSVVTGALASAAAGLQANASVTSFTVLDTLANVSAAFSTLNGAVKLASITLTDTSTPTLSLTATQFAADALTIAKITSKQSLTVTGALASGAPGLQSNGAVTSFTILDSAANVGAAFAGVAADAKLLSIAFTDTGTPTLTMSDQVYGAYNSYLTKISSRYSLSVTAATAARASVLQTNSGVASITVSDSLANVNAAFTALSADGKLSSITLTDTNTPTLSLTATQFSADTAVLAKITSKYNLVVSGALTSSANSLQANAAVTSFTVADSSANVVANIGALNADGKLSSIALIDSSTPTLSLTATQFGADTATLAKITSKYKLVVSGALASSANSLQANTAVTSFAVADSSANVVANIGALNAAGKISSITLTDTNPLSITYAQFIADQTAFSKLPSTYTVSVNSVPAAAVAAAAVQANPHVVSFTVSDTAANVTSTPTFLTADTKLSGVTVVGTTSADVLNLAGSRVAATINLNGDVANVSAGLGASSLTFTGSPDAITLGSGASVINYTIQSGDGIETIANFKYGLDQLDISLNGGATSILKAADTRYDGRDNAISLYSGADPAHGVVLINVGSGMTAANLLANHLAFSGGVAIIT